MNIGICGTVGSGKSTTAKEIERLYNLKYISGGNMFRTYAKEHGMTLEELNRGNTDEIDTEIDMSIDDMSMRRDDLVVESRYAAKFCHGFHVFLYCDPYVAAQRIFSNKRSGESFTSVEECLRNNLSRMGMERRKGLHKYQFDMFDMGAYDLILETTEMDISEVVENIVQYSNGVFLRAASLYPTQVIRDLNTDVVQHYIDNGYDAPVEVYYKNFMWYINDGHHRVMSQLQSSGADTLVRCDAIRPLDYQIGISDIYDWEDCGKMKFNIYPKEVKQMIATEALANVKAVLFGNQKQANVINDAVVAIVAQFLDANNVDMSTQESTAEGIYATLKECAEFGVSEKNATFIQLVAGRNSYNVLEEGSPYIVSQNQPNAESPKINFRILVVGEDEPEDEVENGEKEMYAGMRFEKPAAAPDEVFNPDDTIAEQVRKLKDAILPMCPEGVKSEVENEYAQALYCAQAYFDYNSR